MIAKRAGYRVAAIRAEVEALDELNGGIESDCWCDWPDPELPDRTHDEHIDVYGYPDHEPSPEWNVPEPEDCA